MKVLRFWMVILLGWFFLFYNIERISEPINIASFVYVLTVVVAALVIFFPWFYKLSLPWLLLIPMPVFLGLKHWLGYQIAGQKLPLTVTEICAIALTVFLTRKVGLYLEEFQQAMSSVMLGHLQHLARPFGLGQGDMYREVRRAREHEQPLALLTISVLNETLEFSINRFIQEMQQEVVKKYISARLAQFLLEELRDYDIITQRDDHFITLLPGISRDDVVEIVHSLECKAKAELGLTLNIGVATFPEEVTFEKLVEFAEANMESTAANTGMSPEGNGQSGGGPADSGLALSKKEEAFVRQ